MKVINDQVSRLSSKKDWFSLEFSPFGLMGKLFRTEKLETLTHWALSVYELKPIDAIYWSFQEDTICFGTVVPQQGYIPKYHSHLLIRPVT